MRRAVLEAKVKWARGAEALVAKAREASAAEEDRAGRGAGSRARGGASLDWLVGWLVGWSIELEGEEDWAREDKYDAAAFGVFMGSTGFSRFQGGLGEWDEWDDELGMGFDERQPASSRPLCFLSLWTPR